MNHAVYNLDQTVAVGDNPFYDTAIEEFAYQLFKTGSNGYSHIKDLRILPNEGTFWISKQSRY